MGLYVSSLRSGTLRMYLSGLSGIALSPSESVDGDECKYPLSNDKMGVTLSDSKLKFAPHSNFESLERTSSSDVISISPRCTLVKSGSKNKIAFAILSH